MIPNIGVMLAVYAVARLLQVPLEATANPKRWIVLLLISIPAIAIICLLAFDLVMSSTKIELPPELRG